MSDLARPAPATIDRPTTGLDRNPAAVYVASLASAHSRRSATASLRVLAEILTAEPGADPLEFPWSEVRFQHVGAATTALSARYAPSSVGIRLAHLRGVLRAAFQLGLIGADQYQRAVSVKAPRSSKLPAGRYVTKAELAQCFEACADRGPGGARNAALLAVLRGGGLRRAEAVSLDLSDLDLETGRVHVREGKGRKERVAFMHNGALDAVAAWVRIRGLAPGPLLCPVSKAGAVDVRRMTAQAVYYALRRLQTWAGVESFTPHDLRRSFVSDLLEAGADLAKVQRLAGHANPTTTARYDRRGERELSQAVRLDHIPYRRRA